MSINIETNHKILWIGKVSISVLVCCEVEAFTRKYSSVTAAKIQ